VNKKVALFGICIVTLVVLGFIFYRAVVRAGIVSPKSDIGVNTAASPAPALKAVSPEDQAEAIKEAEALIASSPDSPKVENALYTLGSVYEKRGELLKAKEAYQKLMEKFPASGNVARAQSSLDKVNVKLLFSPTITPDSFLYEIQKGDNLTRIAKKYGTTVDLVSKSNSLTPGSIRYGRKVKVTKLKFSIIVDKSQNILTLKANGEIFKTYRVSTGKNNCTPVGTFKITNKIIDPPWYPRSGKMIPSGDPRNVLGSRWLGISKESYGIHGTTDPASIGKSVTEGCIRLRNEEAEELYTIVPEGTEVVIVD